MNFYEMVEERYNKLKENKIDYELATEKQISWLHKHHYNDTENMSKQMADMLIKEFIENKHW